MRYARSARRVFSGARLPARARPACRGSRATRPGRHVYPAQIRPEDVKTAVGALPPGVRHRVRIGRRVADLEGEIELAHGTCSGGGYERTGADGAYVRGKVNDSRITLLWRVSVRRRKS
jgi:hypothetical protein